MAIVEWFYRPTTGTAPYPSPILGEGGGIGAGTGFPKWIHPKWIDQKLFTSDKLIAEVTLIDELTAKVAALEEQVRKLEQALGTVTYTVSVLSAAEVIHCSKYETTPLMATTPHHYEPKKEIDYLGEIRAMIEGGNSS